MAVSTAMSISGTEISKSSRIDACEASNRSPIASGPEVVSASTVARTLAFSVTTCRTRRKVSSSSTDWAFCRSATERSRRNGTPMTWAPRSHAARLDA